MFNGGEKILRLSLWFSSALNGGIASRCKSQVRLLGSAQICSSLNFSDIACLNVNSSFVASEIDKFPPCVKVNKECKFASAVSIASLAASAALAHFVLSNSCGNKDLPSLFFILE